ncbi:sulfurtransferase [Pigmentiphaga aceris]|uniref:Sulfurtransferase n=1 Tax=Pigmentiphaga aceris TaxID=1940612 RepID=A0A5C0AVR9_9BURK|nr:rhodanese-like domain-containing protein [Pigmentiphaga aceris]QEI05704.1 sulfurtransferase [Pigmentiphaga aceris]
MQALFHLIETYGLYLVFANVLVTQLGAPVPAYPTLIMVGALTSRGDYSIGAVLATAVAAALVADFVWFTAGRRYGRRVMAALCKLSLSPDTCMRQTANIYSRWGAPSLLVAKFIPGFASLASTLAGTVGTPRTSFLLFDAAGAAIWTSVALVLGTVFSTAIDDVLATIQALGTWGALLLLAALALFVAFKWWQRHALIRTLRMSRISVHELGTLRDKGASLVILDVRPTDSQAAGRIPGSLPVPDLDISRLDLDIGADTDVILYCDCPNEVTAARLARQLMRRGYRRVRPLTGGMQAWAAAGYAVEVPDDAETLPVS